MEERPQDSSRQSRPIAISETDALEAARLLGILIEQSQRASPTAPSRAELVAAARRLKALRQMRFDFFPERLFDEPGWNMLLELYVSDAEGQQDTVSSLAASASAPPTTALRWIDVLEHSGLIRRSPHPTDRRTVLVHLTDQARKSMDAYLRKVVEREKSKLFPW